MRKYFIYLSLVWLCASCGNEAPQATTPVQQLLTDAGFTEQDEVYAGMYRRYTGTIAGQQVVVNIVQHGNDVQADYYYEKVGRPITLYTLVDSISADGIIEFTEDAPGDDKEPAHWSVKMSADTLAGIWTSGDGAKTFPILLTEHYSEDMQRFGIISIADSVRFIDSLAEPKAKMQYSILLPVGKDEHAQFVRSVILNKLKCDTTNVNECLKKATQEYFTQYRSTSGDVVDNPALLEFNNWDKVVGYSVVYNENNFIVLDNHVYEYTGGAHGNYYSDYINIDRAGKKLLQLSDVINVDTPQLLALLEVQARLRFGLNEKQSLQSRMLADELYVPDNFYIGSKGITFVYGLYEIASYADGIIELYIPYNKITGMLTPYFIQRMNLEKLATAN